jgi:hypothetical protein
MSPKQKVDMRIQESVVKKPLVSIVILNFNGQDMLRECLQSVLKTDYPNYEVIVVDNGSTDWSCNMVEREFPQAHLVKNSKNHGYSEGNNKGIMHSKGEFIALLNNDVVVCPSWLSKLMNEAVKDIYCFYQPKILFTGSRIINSAGNVIQIFGFAYPRGISELDTGQYEKKCTISYASGACVLVSKFLCQKVGLLDGDPVFTFYEDVNWGWRALLLGYKSIYVPSAVVYHRWGGSWGNSLSSMKFFLIERGRISTILRNYSVRTLVSMMPAFVGIEFLVFSYGLARGFASEKIRVYSDIIKNRGRLFKERKKLQDNRRLSDDSIIGCFLTQLNHPYLGDFSTPVNSVLTFFSNLFGIACA